MTQHFIVIGNPIAHSKSPEIHTQFAAQTDINISYQRQYCPDDAASFTAVIEAFFQGGGVGANVTVPFKQMAYDCCVARGGLSEHAKVAGAVNTLLLNKALLETGTPRAEAIYGDNTDGQGLVNHITSLGWPLKGARVALIGAGGAARGAIAALLLAGAPQVSVVNRTVARAKDLADTFGEKVLARGEDALPALLPEAGLVINATSLGLGGGDGPVADLALTPRDAVVLDMVYKPLRTEFLRRAEAAGRATVDGLEMLLRQAIPTFEAIYDQAPSPEVDVRGLALKLLGEA